MSHAGHNAGVKMTLTIRRGAAQRRALRSCATAAGKTELRVVGGLPAIQLRAKSTLGERAGRFLGQLDFDPALLDRDPWRAHLRQMNSTPHRIGFRPTRKPH